MDRQQKHSWIFTALNRIAVVAMLYVGSRFAGNTELQTGVLQRLSERTSCRALEQCSGHRTLACDIKHQMLGSVSSKITWDASCLVLIVREPE